MSNPATNYQGGTLHVADQVTIHGLCSAIASTNPSVNDSVTFTSILGDVVTTIAGDLSTPDGPYIAPYYGRGTASGNAFQATDQATINGVVQTITNGPMGYNGTITVKADFSGNIITVLSGSVDSRG